MEQHEQNSLREVSQTCHECTRRDGRAKAAINRRQNGSTGSAIMAQFLVAADSPEAELVRMQEHELFIVHVTAFAERLIERVRQIVLMRFVDLRPVREIAHELNTTPGCVSLVLHRIIPELRDFLSGRGIGQH